MNIILFIECARLALYLLLDVGRLTRSTRIGKFIEIQFEIVGHESSRLYLYSDHSQVVEKVIG